MSANLRPGCKPPRPFASYPSLLSAQLWFRVCRRLEPSAHGKGGAASGRQHLALAGSTALLRITQSPPPKPPKFGCRLGTSEGGVKGKPKVNHSFKTKLLGVHQISDSRQRKPTAGSTWPKTTLFAHPLPPKSMNRRGLQKSRDSSGPQQERKWKRS